MKTIEKINSIEKCIGELKALELHRSEIEALPVSSDLREKIFAEINEKWEDAMSEMLVMMDEIPCSYKNPSAEATSAETSTEAEKLEGEMEPVFTQPVFVQLDILPKQEKEEKKVKKKVTKKRVSQEEQDSDPYTNWKTEVNKKVWEIYQRSIDVLHCKDVLMSIFKYMTRNYGIVWEQDFKESSESCILGIIFSNATYKSIFDSVLLDRYTEAIQKEPLTLAEIAQTYIKKINDNSIGGTRAIKKVYASMRKRGGEINWQKETEKYVRENNRKPRTKGSIVRSNKILMESYREAVMGLVTA